MQVTVPTEIKKSYKRGFILTEQELRRIIQACHDHGAKTDGAVLSEMAVVLRDGSRIETQNPEEVFALENAGIKRIAAVEGNFNFASTPAAHINFAFRDGQRDPQSWTSISYEVAGESRDWAFLAAAELDDRVRRVTTLSWDYVFQSKLAKIIVPLLTVFAMVVGFALFKPDSGLVANLKSQYAAGNFHDPIEAIIYVEEYRQKTGVNFLWLLMICAWLVPFVLVFGGSKLLPIIYPSYNFVWGDYVARFEKAKRVRTVIWTVLILGTIASLIAAIVAKRMGL
jgi:hypothetical protein